MLFSKARKPTEIKTKNSEKYWLGFVKLMEIVSVSQQPFLTSHTPPVARSDNAYHLYITDPFCFKFNVVTSLNSAVNIQPSATYVEWPPVHGLFF